MGPARGAGKGEPTTGIRLPAPATVGPVSVEAAIARRRSVRTFRADPLNLGQLSQLLWAVQGTTGPGGLRSAPSAGASYPLEVYVLAGNVRDLKAGAYHYVPELHALEHVGSGDVRTAIAGAADQEWLAQAPAIILVAAVFERTARRYGSRGTRYVHMEAGHAAENVYLQAAALGLGTVVVGAFDDTEVGTIAHIASDARPLALLPVGRPGGL